LINEIAIIQATKEQDSNQKYDAEIQTKIGKIKQNAHYLNSFKAYHLPPFLRGVGGINDFE